jgi:RimJ/RimL family protein N-acetyltransferase
VTEDRRSLQVRLRPVGPADIPIFFEHQADPIAARLAAFAPRDLETHARHWERILGDQATIARTIVVGHDVVGNVVSWLDGDRRLVGYWVARSHWSRGIATQALRSFVHDVAERPLFALVAAGNTASIRVLEKAGFSRRGDPNTDDMGIEELTFELTA